MHGMDHMIRVMAKATGAPLHDIFKMASLTPARRTAIADEAGSLEAGKRADILLMSQNLDLEKVYLAGHPFGD